MIYEVLVLGLTLFLLYSIYLIFWDKGPPRQGGPIEDFIIAADHNDDDGKTIRSPSIMYVDYPYRYTQLHMHASMYGTNTTLPTLYA